MVSPSPEELARYDLLIVSDLHLTLTLDDEDGATDRVLAAFLDHYREHRNRGRTWRLLLAGDVFEFVYPDMRLFVDRHPGPDAPEAAEQAGFLSLWSVQAVAWRLRVTMRERAPVFAALLRFVAAGHRVEILKGNHDVELQWARVQRAFFDGLEELAQEDLDQDRATLEERIRFLNWFWYEPGRVYVEHGNQYDEFNSLPNFLDPALVTDPDRSFSPMGSRLTTYMTNAFVDYKPRPEAGAFMEYLEETGQKWSRKYIGRSLRVLHHSLLGSGLFSEEGWQAGSGRQDEGLQQIGLQSGLPAETLSELQALQAPPVTAQRGWLFNRFGLDRMAIVLFGVAMVVLGLIFDLYPPTEPALVALGILAPVGLVVGLALRLKFKAGRRWHKWFALAGIMVGCVGASLTASTATAWGSVIVSYAAFVTTFAFLVLPLTDASDLKRHLVVTANRVGRLLDVPLVVFGHHHAPTERELQDGRRYINSGAWANCGQGGSQAHVLVLRDEDGTDRAELRLGADYMGGEA